MNKKNLIVFAVTFVIALPLFLWMFGIIGSGASYTACDCANIYESENNPVNIEYSAEELNSGSKMTDDVDTWVEMARFCTIEYGNLSDVELELTKSARSIAQMSGFTKAQLNAKKKCK